VVFLERPLSRGSIDFPIHFSIGINFAAARRLSGGGGMEIRLSAGDVERRWLVGGPCI